MLALTNPIVVDKQKVLTQIGYANEYQPSTHIMSLVNDYIENYHDLLSPSYSYTIKDVVSVEGSIVTIEGSIQFKSKVIARLLEPGDARWPRPERPTVSDFWFDESRALGSCWPASPELSVLFRLVRRLEPRLVHPRLIVLLEVPVTHASAGPDAAMRKQFGRSLQRQLRRRNTGPVLRLANPRSEKALEEVAAAIQAMTDQGLRMGEP